MNFQVLNDLLLNQPLLTLFTTVALGLLLGRISINGIQLGSSGVLFNALMAGHLFSNSTRLVSCTKLFQTRPTSVLGRYMR